MRSAARALVVLLAAGCATTRAPAPLSSGAVGVARFSGRTLSLSEVDASAEDELFKLQEEIYEARVNAAERIALEALVTHAANQAHLTREQWIQARVEKEAQREPTEEELRELFDKAKGQLPPGADYDEVKPSLRQALQREAQAGRARELFEQLKKEAGYEVLLEEPPRPRKSVEAKGPFRGPSDASVTIVVFADFQCPFCARAAKTMEGVLGGYPGKVRLVYRHFPLSFHPLAPGAAEAASCAEEQGRFWEFHDALYAHQDALGPGDLRSTAAGLGLDEKRFEECLASGRTKALVQRDLRDGEKLGVSGTPAYFVNGLMLAGAQPEEVFKRVIDRELARLGK